MCVYMLEEAYLQCYTVCSISFSVDYYYCDLIWRNDIHTNLFKQNSKCLLVSGESHSFLCFTWQLYQITEKSVLNLYEYVCMYAQGSVSAMLHGIFSLIFLSFTILMDLFGKWNDIRTHIFIKIQYRILSVCWWLLKLSFLRDNFTPITNKHPIYNIEYVCM